MKIGFLVNPVAGMGGAVALKGTDGEETLRRALELGATPKAGARAAEAVRIFAEAAEGHQFFAPSGVMGGEQLSEYGIKWSTLFEAAEHTAPADTRRAARMMLQAGVDLIVFTGGDGTARDVCAEAGEDVPVVGIPAGVKIHSGVYAKRPREAGMLIKSFLLGNVRRFAQCEVVDIDEDAFRNDVVRAKLYGYMTIPDDREFMQERKSGGAADAAEAGLELASFVARSMEPGTLYLVGSGSTTKKITDKLGLNGTLLGVDAVFDGKLLGSDLTSDNIQKLLTQYPRDRRALIITVIGGQGHIFGRGNQQLSPDVIRMIDRKNIMVIATPGKMANLFGRPLIADTGDDELDGALKGYIPVITGNARKLMAKIG